MFSFFISAHSIPAQLYSLYLLNSFSSTPLCSTQLSHRTRVVFNLWRKYSEAPASPPHAPPPRVPPALPRLPATLANPRFDSEARRLDSASVSAERRPSPGPGGHSTHRADSLRARDRRAPGGRLRRGIPRGSQGAVLLLFLPYAHIPSNSSMRRC